MNRENTVSKFKKKSRYHKSSVSWQVHILVYDDKISYSHSKVLSEAVQP